MQIAKTLSIIGLSILGLNLQGCNSGNSDPSASSSGPTNQSLTVPNANTVLANDAVISLATSKLLTAPGKTTFTQLNVRGGNSKLALNLSALALKKTPAGYQQDSQLKISFDHPLVTTGKTLATTKIRVDASSAQAGDYKVQILATSPGLKNQLTPQNAGVVVATLTVSVDSSNMIQASYLQLDTAYGAITQSGFAASNLIFFSFANPTDSSVNPEYLAAMQTAITQNAQPSTQYFIALGGALNAGPNEFNTDNADEIVATVVAEINAYNQQLTGGQITGVDLDMENSITADTISALAQGFRANGLLVSVAPQVINLSGSNVDPLNPSNLGLSSGGQNNQYAQAVANGDVDYIMAQTYNTGGWTVGGYAENQVEFFSAIAQALNNTVKSDCSGATNLCIPATTPIIVGEVSNAGAGGGAGNANNIFNSDGSTSYDQAAILGQLQSQIPTVLSNYANIVGVAQWSLNNDYNPTQGNNDSYASAGAFSATIFNAAVVPPLPYFILQVTNTAPDQANAGAYASATLVVDGSYLIFGNKWNQPITPSAGVNYQQWGTSPSASANPSYVELSDALNDLFRNGATSFTTDQILINGYSSQSQSIYQPTDQYNCSMGAAYTFYAGHTYNLSVNANTAYTSCNITILN